MPPEHEWTPIRGGGGSASGDEIKDTDSDTGWQTEAAPDEDILRGRTKGVECAKYSDAGILTLVKQAMAGVYQDAAIDQDIETGKAIRVMHDTEFYDVHNEFNSTIRTGTNTAIAANKLIDSTASFTAADLDSVVWNTTDNTYALVSAVDSGIQLSLDTDIFPAPFGDGYKLFQGKYTATEAGKYFTIAGVQYLTNIADQGAVAVHIFKNGATVIGEATVWSAKANSSLQLFCATVADLAANDYLFHTTKHWEGAVKALNAGTQKVFFYVVKIA